MEPKDCENCWNYDYDQEYDEYYCIMDMDEDEVCRYLRQGKNTCPYFRRGDEYFLARRQ